MVCSLLVCLFLRKSSYFSQEVINRLFYIFFIKFYRPSNLNLGF